MCNCCSVTVSARILAIISLVISILLIGTSSWVLKDTYELRENNFNRAVKGLGDAANSVGTFFGAEKIDLDQRNRILLACSGVGVAAGGLQLLASILLLVGASGKSRSPSGIFSFVGSVALLALVGSLACLFYQKVFDIERLDSLEDKMQYWLGAMAGDGVFLLFGVCVAGSFMRA